jgi:UTP--glucose-1-phosphate uridylyltransferase
MSIPSWFEALDGALRVTLQERGFSAARCEAWMAEVRRGRAGTQRLGGQIEALALEAIPSCTASDRLVSIGSEALDQGQVAACILAGGMATRMGGLVKALVEVAPDKSFLDWRIDELQSLGARHSHTPPLWLMTSLSTDADIRRAIDARDAADFASTFEQDAALRLTPEGALWRDGHGKPSLYATGHGDLIDALKRSGLLASFIERGGRYVWISNIDNLCATIDPLVLGHHIDAAEALTVELVDTQPGDRGGRPILLDGRPVIAEDFRFPAHTDPSALPTFNTNTFIVDAVALAALDMPWTYFRVEKTVDDAAVVQFERLLGEMSFALQPAFLRVPRGGPNSRFRPIKTLADLEALRATTCAAPTVGVD